MIEKNREKRTNDVIEKIIGFVKRTNIYYLTYGPPLIVMGLLIIVTFVGKNFIDKLPKSGTVIAGLLIGLSMSFSGFAQIIKKETPGLLFGKPIRGTWALISGWVMVIFFLGASILVLLAAIFGW